MENASNLKVEQAVLSRLTSVRGPDSRGDYVSLCPFHDEKDPSFSVNFDKGCYYCFGCDSSGKIDHLARHLGITLPSNSAIAAGAKAEVIELPHQGGAIPSVKGVNLLTPLQNEFKMR